MKAPNDAGDAPPFAHCNLTCSPSLLLFHQQTTEFSNPISGDRRYSVFPGGAPLGGRPAGPVAGAVHRNVSAFGEITVMRVGGGNPSDDDIRIAVGEEIM